MDAKSISYNFSVIKVLAILIVATGHFLPKDAPLASGFWIIVSIALFLFSFSSGYFTSNKYKDSFSFSKFWKAKIVRLLPTILIIDIFLLAIFLIQGKTEILSWQTIPALFGMSGILNWFQIENISPFGRGLWFFTVLILFYLMYPLINCIFTSKKTGYVWLIVLFSILTVFHFNITIGYMIWLTIFGFIFGTFCGKYTITIPPKYCVTGFLISTICMVLINKVFGSNTYNYFFIALCSISACLFLINHKLPEFTLNKITILSGCIMEIYFIHIYLFVHPSEIQAVDYLISMLVIIISALFFSKMTQYLVNITARKKTI